MNVLFCRVAWMENYEGDTESDRPIGGGAWVDENGFGSEVHNYSVIEIPAEDCCLELSFDEANQDIIKVCKGFVMTHGKINLQRLGSSKHDDYLAGVLVVWVAKHPDQGGMRIVGWYNNATVFKEFQDDYLKAGTDYGRYGCLYNIMCKARDAYIISPEGRDFILPRATKHTSGLGQSNTWFADKKEDRLFVELVIKHLDYLETIAEVID